MNTSDPSITKKPMEYSRVIINVPTGLLKDFDKVCGLQYYSRAEAIKQAIRMFIDDSYPDEYMSPEESTEQYTAMWQGMVEALVKIQDDPKYQALQQKDDCSQSDKNTLTKLQALLIAEQENQDNLGFRIPGEFGR